MNNRAKIEAIIVKLNDIDRIVVEESEPPWDTFKKTKDWLHNNIEELSKGFNQLPKYMKREIEVLLSGASHHKGIRDTVPLGIKREEWEQLADDLRDAISAYVRDE